jgi:hypothetical protein
MCAYWHQIETSSNGNSRMIRTNKGMTEALHFVNPALSRIALASSEEAAQYHARIVNTRSA